MDAGEVLVPGTVIPFEALRNCVRSAGDLGSATSATYVVTTVDDYRPFFGGGPGPGHPGGSDLVVVLQMVGRFSRAGTSRPMRAHVPLDATVLRLCFDATTGRLRGRSFSEDAIDLGVLGQVRTLA
jgi:hypothetical protein